MLEKRKIIKNNIKANFLNKKNYILFNNKQKKECNN